MSLGSDLVKLQETDLELASLNKQLGSLPIIDELVKKRSALSKLRTEATRLLAVRKDAQIAVDDLDEGERACHEAVSVAQARPMDPSDYRAMRDLEEELSNLAKRLERIEFDRPAARDALAAAQERERKLVDYIKRFEAAIVEDTRSARDQASAIQAEIDELSLRRSRLFGRLPQDVQKLYERSSKRFKGLCVERIQGNVPTVCRTALQPASMDALRHASFYAECPYCHRIIVVDERE